MTWKTTIGFTPFELLYGKVEMLPIEFEHKKLRTTLELDIELPIAQRECLLHLNSLDEIRKLLWSTLKFYKNKENNGMTLTLSTNNFKLVTGHYYMISDLKRCQESYRQDGWVHMKLIMFLIMDLSN